MPITIDGGPWEYLPVLNECIKILVTVGIGSLMGCCNVFQANAFVPQATKFVFYVALPMLVIKGLGIGIDMYDDSFIWEYICAFLFLRVIALIISFGIIFVVRRQQHDEDEETTTIGQVAVLWLTFTWISTVILGVPISAAVFGDPMKGKVYGILAAISSFIFQLPFQLFFLEYHDLMKHRRRGRRRTNQVQQVVPVDDVEKASLEETEDVVFEEQLVAPNSTEIEMEAEPSGFGPSSFHHDDDEEGGCCDIWKRIIIQLLKNPVLWGIAIGFYLTLSGHGTKYLNPTSEDYIPGLGWIMATAGWLGDCVSPLSLVAMGVWMHHQGWKGLFQVRFITAILCMVAKLIITPLVMIGLALALNLDDEPGRAAVLIAALPISMASFTLASRYQIGEALMSENVALGTLLVLPTILIWNLVLDAFDLFPIAT